MKKFIYLLLLVVSWPSFAARQFDIEVILFKRNINPEQVNESWPDAQKPIDLRGTIAFSDTEHLAAKGVRVLPPSQYQLNNEYAKLKNHAGFTPLAHIAWRQGDKSRGAAPRIHLTAGKDFSDRYFEDGSSRDAVTAQANQDFSGTTPSEEGGIVVTTDNGTANTGINNINESAIKNSLFELDGKLQVYVQHYLFVEADLDLREPGRREVIVGTEPLEIDTLGNEGNVQVGHLQEVKKRVEVEEFLKDFRFKQTRRMKSSETHYLDHPLMGMIIQVRRVGA
ncbi:peptidoglycan binding protein CsiV [Photobacterium sanguinicancri]|uniref:Peptidoglycan binding protein CsiV n=1 Tax=Photobacterium sanguinicancri TaxID=875932 RepID=A0AAW7Y3H6_9GAMM|nr:peptidoglycan binding protein CsiV [Photobacterium sanguinicancri]MDO6541195.1 peptidoglycan binding protein CsiV [Photobacterium sanguinicancri]